MGVVAGDDIVNALWMSERCGAMKGKVGMTPEVDKDGVLVGGQCQDIHKVVTVEIAKCYNSAIAVVEAQGPRANEGATREALWRKRPKCGGGCSKEGNASNEEEKRKTPWRPKSPVEENSHSSACRCKHM